MFAKEGELCILTLSSKERNVMDEHNMDKHKTITARLVSTKWVSGDFGDSLKMLVQDDDGNRYYGTMPRSLREANQVATITEFDEIQIEAEVKQTEDPMFYLFRRPSQGTIKRDVYGTSIRENQWVEVDYRYKNINTQETVRVSECVKCGTEVGWVRSLKSDKEYPAQAFNGRNGQGWVAPWIPHFTVCEEVQGKTDKWVEIQEEVLGELNGSN